MQVCTVPFHLQSVSRSDSGQVREHVKFIFTQPLIIFSEKGRANFEENASYDVFFMGSKPHRGERGNGDMLSIFVRSSGSWVGNIPMFLSMA